MGLTLFEALSIPPLDRCKIVAGENGLSREINSVNSFDAPDVMKWLKAGDLVLTSGYVFDNEFDLVSLIEDLAKLDCAGLVIKLSELPENMIKIANKLNLPIIEIPEDLSVSDLLAPVLRQVFIYQGEKYGQEKKNEFIRRLINKKLKSKEAILSEGSSLGLYQAAGYICLCITPFTNRNKKFDFISIQNKFESFASMKKVHLFFGEYEDNGVIIVQSQYNYSRNQKDDSILQMKDDFIEFLKKEFEKDKIYIGLGSYQTDISNCPTSYNEAYEAIQFGKLVSPNENVYEFSTLQIYTILRHIPSFISENFIANILGPLINYDKENNSNLIQTLETYLNCSLKPSETGNQLGVHRNTIHFRIAKIKELLNINFDDGNMMFQLNCALRLLHLNKTNSLHV
ncbi:PucR family transcriptional regulator [Metabacillus fastidiosus]|uniref:PucR family transcriptional regulator n=1 Tax=Metabacillus fastidiosus TaxID=1458 RepID=UPI003D2BEC4D